MDTFPLFKQVLGQPWTLEGTWTAGTLPLWARRCPLGVTGTGSGFSVGDGTSIQAFCGHRAVLGVAAPLRLHGCVVGRELGPGESEGDASRRALRGTACGFRHGGGAGQSRESQARKRPQFMCHMPFSCSGGQGTSDFEKGPMWPWPRPLPGPSWAVLGAGDGAA